MSIPKAVTICEVGPRDGLQNEEVIISTTDKIHYIDLLSQSGLRMIESTSFVRPDTIPQLSDAAELFAGISRVSGVRYLVLTPNLKGLERAKAAGATSIAVFASATEAFSKQNINMSIEESLTIFGRVIREARNDGIWIRGYISTAFGCPYEGFAPVENVLHVIKSLYDLGCDELSIGDTIGVAVPTQVDELIPRILRVIPRDKIALHFHDTRGTALANIYAALQHGITIFDSSSGGLGGCPYAPGASGNVATEDLLYMLHGMGIQTGVDLSKVCAASRFIAERLDHRLPSKAYTAFETRTT